MREVKNTVTRSHDICLVSVGCEDLRQVISLQSLYIDVWEVLIKWLIHRLGDSGVLGSVLGPGFPCIARNSPSMWYLSSDRIDKLVQWLQPCLMYIRPRLKDNMICVRFCTGISSTCGADIETHVETSELTTSLHTFNYNCNVMRREITSCHFSRHSCISRVCTHFHIAYESLEL